MPGLVDLKGVWKWRTRCQLVICIRFIVRIIFVTAFLLGFVLFPLIAYVAAVLLIEKKPLSHQFDTMAHHIKQKPWQQGRSATLVLAELEADIKQLEQKIEQVERHVTSREFELNRQFKHL